MRGGKALSSRKSFSIRAGKSKTVKLKLNRKAKRAVRRQHRLRARATLVTRSGKSAKAARVRASRTITIQVGGKRKGSRR